MSNKRIRKKKKKQQPTLQEAWNVVAEHLNEDGEVTYFIGRPDDLFSNTDKRWDIHAVAPNRTIIISEGLK